MDPLVQGEAVQGRGQRVLAAGQTAVREAITAELLADMELEHCFRLSVTHCMAVEIWLKRKSTKCLAIK